MSQSQRNSPGIPGCRICGNTALVSILDLGNQAFTGVFPRSAEDPVGHGSLELVKCHGANPADHCGLLQLRHSFPADQMYGQNYGYRSGLNASMVEHLQGKIRQLATRADLQPGDLALDIGSNDATTLNTLQGRKLQLVGMDPTGAKFRQYYGPEVELIADFFSRSRFENRFGQKKARLITSIAMFYDLEQPQAFVDDIAGILAPDGLWHFEQSYMPSMLELTAYDTVCHEHLEYYGLRQIEWLLERAGLEIRHVELNSINGGSFAVTAGHRRGLHASGETVRLREMEKALGLDNLGIYESFQRKVARHRDALREVLSETRARGKKILGYGASTKGNVLLQFCGLNAQDLPAIMEVNPDKFGCLTPGTHIPIISEAQGRELRPDLLLVLPWHFRQNLVAREKDFLARGGRMLFPLPQIEWVPSDPRIASQ